MGVNMFDKPIAGSFMNTYSRMPFKEIAMMGNQLEKTKAEGEAQADLNRANMKMDALNYGDLNDTRDKQRIFSGYEAQMAELDKLWYSDPEAAKAKAKAIGLAMQRDKQSGEWASIQNRYDLVEAKKKQWRDKYVDHKGGIEDPTRYNQLVSDYMPTIEQTKWDPSSGTTGSVGVDPDFKWTTAEQTRENAQKYGKDIKANQIAGSGMPTELGDVHYTTLMRDAAKRKYVDWNRAAAVIVGGLSVSDRKSSAARDRSRGVQGGNVYEYEKNTDGSYKTDASGAPIPKKQSNGYPVFADNELGNMMKSVVTGNTFSEYTPGSIIKVKDGAAEDNAKEDPTKNRSTHRTYGIAGGSNERIVRSSLPGGISDMSFNDDGSISATKTKATPSTGSIGGSGSSVTTVDEDRAKKERSSLIETANYYGIQVGLSDTDKQIYDKVFNAYKDYSAREITATTLSENASLGYGKEFNKNLSGTKMYLAQEGSLVGDPNHSNGEVTNTFADQLGYNKKDFLTTLGTTLDTKGISGIISSGVYTGHSYVELPSKDGKSFRNVILEPDEENKAANRVAVEASELRDNHRKGLVSMKNGSAMFINPTIGPDGTFDESVHMMIPRPGVPLDVPIKSLDTEVKINKYFKKATKADGSPMESATFEDIMKIAEENFINQGENYIGRHLWVAPKAKRY